MKEWDVDEWQGFLHVWIELDLLVWSACTLVHSMTIMHDTSGFLLAARRQKGCISSTVVD